MPESVASVLLADGLRMGPIGAGDTLPLNCLLRKAVTGIVDHLCSPMASSSNVALETLLCVSSRRECASSISVSEEGRLEECFEGVVDEGGIRVHVRDHFMLTILRGVGDELSIDNCARVYGGSVT